MTHAILKLITCFFFIFFIYDELCHIESNNLFKHQWVHFNLIIKSDLYHNGSTVMIKLIGLTPGDQTRLRSFMITTSGYKPISAF